MCQFVFHLFLLIAVSNAAERKISFTSGNIIQGKYSTVVSVKNNDLNQQEIEWKQQFDSNNDLTIYLSHIYESTGKLEIFELPNLCEEYPEESFNTTIKSWVLQTFRGTSKCPIRKGKRTIRYPLTNNYEASSGKAENCGTIIATVHIVKNKNPNTDEAPLLISARLRGVISGDDC